MSSIGAAVGQDRHVGVAQFPRCPRPRDPCLGHHGPELGSDDLRVRDGVVPGAEDVDDPDRLPAVHCPPLPLPHLVLSQHFDDQLRERGRAPALRSLGVTAFADRAPHLDVGRKIMIVDASA